MAGKQLKTGVRLGGGPPPGYQWGVVVLDLAHRESSRLLTAPQQSHMRQQVRELARHIDPTHSETISIDKVEEFYEMRDRGGVLGGKNVRLFYGIDDFQRSVCVLGVIIKQNNGPTPLGDKVRMRCRWRDYRSGAFGVA